ncbi:MAG: BrnT family toxin [Saprospiraceae bacterium]|nr:BrnT family toxin [Saprospiraceae bacterium]MDW8228436.1 BrnT family toxin [Saprospiraceae bacterium]
MKFEWDERKDQFHRRKHGIGFNRAKEVFEDNDAALYSGKNRLLIVGKVLGKFIVAVAFTQRGTVYRIIPARQARKEEIKDYLTNKFDKDDTSK